MARPNLEQRREEVGRLLRYHVRFDPVVLNSLASEFGRSRSTIRSDLRVVGSTLALQSRLDAAWRRV